MSAIFPRGDLKGVAEESNCTAKLALTSACRTVSALDEPVMVTVALPVSANSHTIRTLPCSLDGDRKKQPEGFPPPAWPFPPAR